MVIIDFNSSTKDPVITASKVVDAHTDTLKQLYTFTCYTQAWKRSKPVTESQRRMMLHKRPTVIVHTMVFIDEKLAQVSRRHVGWDLHHLSHPVLAEYFYNLKEKTTKM